MDGSSLGDRFYFHEGRYSQIAETTVLDGTGADSSV